MSGIGRGQGIWEHQKGERWRGLGSRSEDKADGIGQGPVG